MKKAINHQIMRSSNKQQILELFRKKTPVTKKEIADKLGISFTAVSSFLAELLEQNRILTLGTAQSTGGRRSELYHLNPDCFYVIGADIQVDRLITLLINVKGEIIKSAESFFERSDARNISDLLSQSIFQLCNSAQVPFSKIAGIGIGVPGIVNRDSGIIKFAPNLGWSNINLRSQLSFDLPVIIENEANAAAIGELHFGSAQNKANLIYVSVGVGIGTGLIINHDLFYGHSFLAGEFGHMTIVPQGLSCSCGKNGCWEVYASNEAALRFYSQYSGSKLNTYDQLLEAFFKDDPFAVKALNDTISYLGLGIANLINGLNPETVIIGGKITEAADLIRTRLFKEVEKNCFPYSYNGISLQFSSLKNYATALGVGNLMIDNLIYL